MTAPVVRGSELPVKSGAPDARLIVLGPSLGTTSSLWDVAAAALSDTSRVLLFDLPGHGSSPAATGPFTLDELADAVITLVDSVGGGSFSYAGDSLGGAIGLALAVRHPARLLGVTAFSAPARFGTPEGWRDRAARVRAGGTASVVGLSAERWFAPDYLAREPGARAAALDRLLSIDDESYALCCEALAAWDLTQSASSIAVPVTCAVGDADVATTPDEVAALCRLIPGAKFVVVPGAGHLPVMERPQESVAIIRGTVGPTTTRDFQDFLTDEEKE